MQKEFSPVTYRNPCIPQMDVIIKNVAKRRQVTYQKVELIVIDAEEGYEDDREDIMVTLAKLVQGLNYLLLITDRPGSYGYFMDTVYEESGLIVQQVPKSARKGARGNFILDFERSGGISADTMIRPEAIYLPIYKKPWEIAENLDIIVPVGYNTLVVEGIFQPQQNESCFMDNRFVKDTVNYIDRLDREFRKG